jgi:hypothetical protein
VLTGDVERDFPASADMNHADTGPERDFQDRSRWLVLAGLAEILIGCLCGLVSLLLPILSRYFQQNPETATITGGGMMALNISMFLALALLFGWLGVGTIRARRWARDLMLITAWIWLMAGILTFILLFLVVPRELSKMALSGQELLSGSELAVFMIVYAVFVGFVYIILPGMFVLFYSGKNVRKTFESRDPVARWTSKCPLPVLTASQFLAGGAITLLILSIYSNVVPFFGWAITGIPARLILIMAAVLSGYLTWAIYKLKAHSWWVNFCFSVLSLVWFVGSCSKLDLARYITGGRFSFQLDDRTLSAVFIILGLAWVVFLILIKKHFKESRGQISKIQQ